MLNLLSQSKSSISPISPIARPQQSMSTVSQTAAIKGKQRLGLSVWSALFGGLAVLLQSGLPLSKALALQEAEERNAKARGILQRLQLRIRRGQSFDEALADDTLTPPSIVVPLMKAGRLGGTLAAQLDRAAKILEAQRSLQASLIQAAVYPASLLALLVLVVAFLSFVVIPEFQILFEEMGTSAPRETQFVIDVAQGFRDHWFLVIAASLIAITTLKMLLSRSHQLVLVLIKRFPVLGRFKLDLEANRFCRLLGALLSGGTSMSNAFPVAKGAIKSPALRKQLTKVETLVRSGKPLASSLSEYWPTHPRFIQFVQVGEQSGTLADMLLKASAHFDDVIAQRSKSLTAIATPALTAIMGLLTAGIIASVLSGILALNEVIYAE